MKRKITHGSICTGIGAFDLAAEWMNWRNVFQVEIDPFCQKVLAKHFPKVKKYEDIKTFKGTPWKKKVDVITAGFPCQPFSLSGKRQGKKDDRHIWPAIIRVVKQIQPSFFLGENVPGITNLALDQVLTDLESAGYTTETFNLPACSVNATHQRQRIWIMAYANRLNLSGEQNIRSQQSTNQRANRKVIQQPTSRTKKSQKIKLQRKKGGLGRITEPPFIRRNDGLPKRLDEDRCKALGNAVVPHIPHLFFQWIDQVYLPKPITKSSRIKTTTRKITTKKIG